MKPLYVLYIEHDHDAHGVSLHLTEAAVEEAVRLLAFKLGIDSDARRLCELAENLAACGEHVRVYRCPVGHPGVELELDLFELAA